ncbi:MAG: uroporphyrinogen-III synthase [Fimbriimonas sp.]|nr:uroporphyrinogen-III synthase [Fimbriimonas sp.]
MDQPLAGKRILVTRPRGQASQLADRLQELGAIPVQLPAIEIAPPLDYAPVDTALRGVERYDWIVMTSVNGVESVSARMDTLGLSREPFRNRRIAVIGPATAAATALKFREPDLVPAEYVSEAISAAIEPISGKRFLLLRADIARKDLAEELRRRGGDVTEVAVYRIVSDRDAKLAEDEPRPDYITLTSSASVHATLAKLREAGREVWMRKVPIACIGPITAKTVTDLGFSVSVGAAEYTIPGLVEAIVRHAKGVNHV